MKGSTVTSLLNASGEMVRSAASPWSVPLLVLGIPAVLAESWLYTLLIELRGNLNDYTSALSEAARIVVATKLLAWYGRLTWVRALTLPPQTLTWRHVLSVPAPQLFGYVLVAACLDVCAHAFVTTIVVLPIAIILSGHAAAASTHFESVGLRAPLRALRALSSSKRVLVGANLVLAVAIPIAAVNLAAVFSLVQWVARLSGARLDALTATLSLDNVLFTVLLLRAGALLIEPFWLAANVAYVDRSRASRSGADLVAWFAHILASRETRRA